MMFISCLILYLKVYQPVSGCGLCINNLSDREINCVMRCTQQDEMIIIHKKEKNKVYYYIRSLGNIWKVNTWKDVAVNYNV
jgi:hypothetical protein